MEIDMSIINWIILGFIAGIIASKIVNKTGERFTLDITDCLFFGKDHLKCNIDCLQSY